MASKPKMQQQNLALVRALLRAYNAELETLMNYLANSHHLDGVRAKQVAESLAKDVPEELAHAHLLARRIKTIGGVPPGSYAFNPTQGKLQPPKDSTDVIKVIKGVIAAEEDAIRTYGEIIKLAEGKDYATQDMAIKILAEEEEHRREFVGFLKEYEKHP